MSAMWTKRTLEVTTVLCRPQTLQSSTRVSAVRFSINDDMFTHGNETLAGGHLIWVDECPLVLKGLELDMGDQAMCSSEEQGRVLFFGPALVKRHKRHGRDMLVFLLPDVDLGHLSPEAMIKLNCGGLELE